jgi:transposase-like protein
MFSGRHFDQTAILPCVSWCLAYNLSCVIWKR